MKIVLIASVAAIAVAAVVGVLWLGLFIWVYRMGKYDVPLLRAQVEQLVVTLTVAAVTVAAVLHRRRPAQSMKPERVKTLAIAFASAVTVAAVVGLLWLGLWMWMARYYSPTHIRIDIDIPQPGFYLDELIIVPAAAVVIFALVLYHRRRAT